MASRGWVDCTSTRLAARSILTSAPPSICLMARVTAASQWPQVMPVTVNCWDMVRVSLKNGWVTKA